MINEKELRAAMIEKIDQNSILLAQLEDISKNVLEERERQNWQLRVIFRKFVGQNESVKKIAFEIIALEQNDVEFQLCMIAHLLGCPVEDVEGVDLEVVQKTADNAEAEWIQKQGDTDMTQKKTKLRVSPFTANVYPTFFEIIKREAKIRMAKNGKDIILLESYNPYFKKAIRKHYPNAEIGNINLLWNSYIRSKEKIKRLKRIENANKQAQWCYLVRDPANFEFVSDYHNRKTLQDQLDGNPRKREQKVQVPTSTKKQMRELVLVVLPTLFEAAKETPNATIGDAYVILRVTYKEILQKTFQKWYEMPQGIKDRQMTDLVRSNLLCPGVFEQVDEINPTTGRKPCYKIFDIRGVQNEWEIIPNTPRTNELLGKRIDQLPEETTTAPINPARRIKQDMLKAEMIHKKAKIERLKIEQEQLTRIAVELAHQLQETDAQIETVKIFVESEEASLQKLESEVEEEETRALPAPR